MSFAAVGSFITATSTSISLSNQSVGDLILIEVGNPDTTVWATSVSGGGATWSQVGSKFTGTTNAKSAVVFAGKVTSTGPQTATVTFNGTPTNIRIVGQEFSSTLGGWVIDAQANLDSSGTATWPTLTPTNPHELYFGYAIDGSSAVTGSTSGFTYNTDSTGNGCAFNPDCSFATSPTWGNSSQLFGIMVLIEEVHPITYNTGVAATSSAASSVAFTIPAQVKAGDVMLLSVQCFTEVSTAPTVNFSGGGGSWSLIPMSDSSANPRMTQNAGVYSYGYAYQRVATPSDIGAAITINETGSAASTTWWAVAMAAYTGANQINPIDQAKSNSVPAQTSTSVTTPTVTTRIAGDWPVYLFTAGIGAGSSITQPSGSTTRQSVNSGSGVAAAISDENGPSGLRNVGGGSWSSSGFSSNAWLETFTICLAPAGIYKVGTAGFAPNNSASPVTVTYTSTPGSTLIISGYLYNGAGSSNYPTSITDTASNTWQLSTTTAATPPTEQLILAGNGAVTTFIAWAVNASAITSLNVARQDTGTNWWRINLTEWFGIVQADNSNVGTTGSTSQSTYNLPSVNISSSNELVIAVMSDLGSAGGSVPTNWTNLGTGFFDWPQGACYIINPPTGSFAPLWTGGASGSWVASAAVFSPVAISSGGGSVTQKLTMFGIV